MQQTPLFRKYLPKVGAFFILTSFSAGVAFLLMQLDSGLRVRNIKVEGVSRTSSFYGLENLKGRRMVFLNEALVEKHVLLANPLFKTVTVSRAYPDTVLLKITKAKPFAYIEGKGGFFLMDPDGKVLSKSKTLPDDADFPVIRYFQKYDYATISPGEELSSLDIKKALRFIRKVLDLGDRVITVDIDGVDVIGLNLTNKVIVFSSEKDADPQMYQLEQVVRQFRVQGKDFKRLDLRYNRPILELAK